MKDKHEELKELAMPLVRYLKNNYNPHCKIEITMDSVEVLSGKIAVSNLFDGDG